MDNWIVVCVFDWHALAFEKLLKMFPVVNLFIQLKAVVKLIHLYFLWVVSISQVDITCIAYLERISANSQPLDKSLLGFVTL